MGLIKLNNGIRNIMEDQYPPIYLSIILKSYLVRKRRLADGDIKRKPATYDRHTNRQTCNNRYEGLGSKEKPSILIFI